MQKRKNALISQHWKSFKARLCAWVFFRSSSIYWMHPFYPLFNSTIITKWKFFPPPNINLKIIIHGFAESAGLLHERGSEACLFVQWNWNTFSINFFARSLRAVKLINWNFLLFSKLNVARGVKGIKHNGNELSAVTEMQFLANQFECERVFGF